MVDTNNAHIRGRQPVSSAREESGRRADEADRLLNDPAFVRAYDTVRNTLVGLIENHHSDGSPESEAYEREMCRSLRNLRSVRGALNRAINNEKLRAADFRAQPPQGEA